MHAMKATAEAPTNIAFIKYMGKDPRGDKLPDEQGKNFPENGSISMCLDGLHSTTTVEFSSAISKDVFVLDGKDGDEKETARTFAHINRIRKLAGIELKARVESRNNFGKSRGLSSSASGFAALSLAGAKAAGLNLNVQELSALARKGSGSAARSVPNGFVDWRLPKLEGDHLVEDSYAYSIYPPEYWDIADVVIVTETEAKKISTTEAHAVVHESRYRSERLAAMPGKLDECRRCLRERDFKALGTLIEEETWDLHLLFISSGIRYLRPISLKIMDLVEEWRSDLEVYYTLNTGQDVHLICQTKDIDELCRRAEKVEGVREVIVNRPGKGARLLDSHLF